MDSEFLLKFIGYFPDYRSALSHMLLRLFGQPLLKQLYTLMVGWGMVRWWVYPAGDLVFYYMPTCLRANL